MGRASPWAADLTEASLFFFSRSNGQLEPPPPIAPFTLHLAITSRTVDTWNMFLCFTLHVAFTLFFLPEQNIAGEQVRRQAFFSVQTGRAFGDRFYSA